MFYVFHGPDELTRSEVLAKMKAQLGDASLADLNTTYLDGASTYVAQIQQACDTLPFLASSRLVVVKNYLSRIGPEQDKGPGDPVALQALCDYLPHLPITTHLVFAEDEILPGKHPVLVLAGKHPQQAQVRLFGVPTGDRDLAEWIEQRVRHKGATIEPSAAIALAMAVGHNMRLLDTEIEKLITYVAGAQPHITSEHVELLVPYTGEAKIWTMVDAIGQRNARLVLQHLHRLIEEDPIENHPLKLFAMIVRQFRILIQVKEMITQGLAVSTIAKQAGIKEFAAEKARQQAMNFSLAQLEAIYARLLHTDLAIKTGKIEDVLALDTLVAALCASPDS
ncbi:MAG: DNA polymerase III subunit delta [Anaerolineae bacterium]